MPLFGALLAPLVVVAALGLRALVGDLERARARYVGEAAGLARVVLAELTSQAESLERHPEALRWAAASDLTLVEPPAAEAPREPAPDRSVREAATAELDQRVLAGDDVAVDTRLAELAARVDRPWLAAWALGWAGARASQRGDVPAARAAWATIASRYPEARDERGLVRALVARSELAALDGDPPEVLEALHRDLVAARRSLSDGAHAALAAGVQGRLARRDAGAAATLAAEARLAARGLAWRAAWSGGVADWLARHPGGGATEVELPADPFLPGLGPARVLVRASRVGGEVAAEVGSAGGTLVWTGVALELATLAEEALARVDLGAFGALGLAVAVEDGAGQLLAGEAPTPEAPTAVERASGALGSLTVRAHGRGFEAFLARERRRVAALGIVASLALLAAVTAGLATVRALDREARVARERAQFVAAVTHELRSPIASIRLLAELLADGEVAPETVRDFGARAVRESDRLARLVDGVLRFARLERGLEPAGLQRLVWIDLVRAAVESIAPLAAERGFEVRVSGDAAVAVRGDRDALLGALGELVDNATKYGDPAGGVEVGVVVVARDGAAGVEVRDRGRGIPEEERERVFEPFYRLGDELRRERPGVGLGLALVRSVAVAHGGAVRCEARTGGGTVFTLTLPADSTP